MFHRKNFLSLLVCYFLVPTIVTRMLPKNVNAAKNVRKIAVKEKRKIVSARTVAAKKRKPATNEYWPVACFYQEQRRSVGPSLFS